MTALPVASRKTVRSYARRVVLKHPKELALALAMQALTAACALVTPWLLGRLVEQVQDGVDRVTVMALLIIAFLLLQALTLGLATYFTSRLAEKVVAELREDFVRDVLDLPLATVESAGAGDLVNRSTRDVDVLAQAARVNVPSTLVTLTTMVVMIGALLLVGWVMIFPCLLAVPVLWPIARWYLSRARDGYLRERASYAKATESLGETSAGARTVESLGLGSWRARRLREDIGIAYAAERYTLHLRSVFLPVTDTAIAIPTVATVVLGGLFYEHGLVSLAGITAATLYTQQLAGLIDVLLYNQDKLQLAGASVARLLGVAQERSEGARGPSGPRRVPAAASRDIEVRGVCYGYTADHDVLHDVSFMVGEGERIAVVGPSGAGKTTLGRLLAGIDIPRTGTVSLGGVPLSDIPRAELRSEIALVTQDYHFFKGSVRDNLLLAKPSAGDDELRECLEAVGAWNWVSDLGLDTRLGSGTREISPAEAQQVSLARLVLSDPHTLVLDEATSLLNPKVARNLERSLAALLAGRTVISIAHRLHTAHDADRVIVMAEGRVVETGSHQELLAASGPYAALWNSWQGTGELSTMPVGEPAAGS
ncbi:ABC transporter ATP-binding protein [Streptomyces sp. NPDC051217]|uniref:ABC transporter ATP-binding protein n=1 Tax=Streptomyces sp. NPDC051217 TaxID=3365644 RepID=UPI0037995EF8